MRILGYIDFPFFRGADGTQLIKIDSKKALQKYVYYYLCFADIPNSSKYERHFKYLKSLLIPLPPKDLQQQIVSECEAEDRIYAESTKRLQEISERTDHLLDESKSMPQHQTLQLSDPKIFAIHIGKRVLKNEVVADGEYDVYSANVFTPFGKTETSVLDDFSKPSVLWGIDGDWMVNCLKAGYKFNPTDHCGVIRVLDESKVLPRYLAYVLDEEGRRQMFSRTNRASTQRIKSLQINVPAIDKQKEIVAEIASFDEEIQSLKSRMSQCSANKQAILDKYLK